MNRWNLLVLLLTIAGIFSQDGKSQSVASQPVKFNYVWQVVPGAMPTTRTCLVGKASTCLKVITTDPYVCEADFTASGQTVLLDDLNATPWIVNGSALTGGWVFVAPGDSACRMFPGGVYVTAGSSGVTGHLTVKFN